MPPGFLDRIIYDLCDTLDAILNSTHASIKSHRINIPQDLSSPVDAIPFAAIVLEFPIAYVPDSSEQTSFLENTPLDVYECSIPLQFGEHKLEHGMLKFSCPSELTKPQEPDKIEKGLRERFSQRIHACGMTAEMVIKKTRVTLDRVAL